jgi:hypothetical protein
MFNVVFYDDSSATSSCSSRVIGVIYCILGNLQITFLREVGFRNERYVNFMTGKKCFQLIRVLEQTICIPQGEL